MSGVRATLTLSLHLMSFAPDHVGVSMTAWTRPVHHGLMLTGIAGGAAAIIVGIGAVTGTFLSAAHLSSSPYQAVGVALPVTAATSPKAAAPRATPVSLALPSAGLGDDGTADS